MNFIYIDNKTYEPYTDDKQTPLDISNFIFTKMGGRIYVIIA